MSSPGCVSSCDYCSDFSNECVVIRGLAPSCRWPISGAAVAKRETTANSTSLNSGYAGHQLETLPLAVHQSWQTIGGLDWRSLQKLAPTIRWCKKRERGGVEMNQYNIIVGGKLSSLIFVALRQNTLTPFIPPFFAMQTRAVDTLRPKGEKRRTGA